MKFLKFFILILIFWNLPSFALAQGNSQVGSALSYLTFLLIIIYYLLSEKEKPVIEFIFLGFLYFLISILVNFENSDSFIVPTLKYFIFIVSGISIIKDTSKMDIYLLLLLGSLSIIYESIFITDIGGRFSGFYLNPNAAGFICILGYCFSFSIESKKLHVLGQFLFSIGGLVTFSRTFLLLWITINLISLLISYKNSSKIIFGVSFFGLILSAGEQLGFNKVRLDTFSSILEGKFNAATADNSRTGTWAAYYDKILESPIFGNGYLSFSGKTFGSGDAAYFVEGVHNVFLMILGESGVFPFIFFIWIYTHLLINSIRNFRVAPVNFLITFSLIMFMLTSHNFFDNFFILFITVWIYTTNNKYEHV